MDEQVVVGSRVGKIEDTNMGAKSGIQINNWNLLKI